MKKQSQAYLFNTFPELFDTSDDAPIRELGIEVQEGWYTIVEKMCRELDHLRSQAPDTFPRIRQIKSKFGGLVVYLSEQEASVEPILATAVAACKRTCEICGSLGVLRRTRRRWYFVACDQHAEGAEIVPDK